MAGIQAWARQARNRAPLCSIVLIAMKAVPWWFQTTAHVLAVAFSIWLGLHLHAPQATQWIFIYGTAAALSAAIPYHRVLGFAGLAAGILIGVWGSYLLRDVWKVLTIDDLLGVRGGLRTGGHEAAMLVLAALWLVIGSTFRTQRA